MVVHGQHHRLCSLSRRLDFLHHLRRLAVVWFVLVSFVSELVMLVFKLVAEVVVIT